MKALVCSFLICAGILALASDTPAPVQEAQADQGWTFGGYIDVYYQFDLGRPQSGNNVNGRGFDIAHNRFRLAVVQMDFSRSPNERSPWGFNLQLYGGKNSELIHLAEPGGAEKYKFIRQAYVTYAAKGVTVDLGKFDTWIGYEGVDNRYQDQYSRSFNWTYSEPTYEMGLRASGKLGEKLTGTLYLVRGWNEVDDGNNRPSMGAALSYAATDKTTITVQNHFGDEGLDHPNSVGSFGGIGFPNAGTSRVHLLDVIISHQLTDKTKIVFNLDHGTATRSTNQGTWNGQVLYLRHQLSPKQAAGLRLERVEDRDGLRVGAPILLHSITGNFDLTLNQNATLRFEVRRDFANRVSFTDRNSMSRNRTTLTVAAVIKL